MATAEELQQLQDELELDLNDIINNPGNYGFTEEIAVYLEGLIADADSNINTIGILAETANLLCKFKIVEYIDVKVINKINGKIILATKTSSTNFSSI